MGASQSTPRSLPPSSRTISTISDDPYTYTSGRWLHRDELQRSSRKVQFDFKALCKRVIDVCPGAHSILRYEKKEGGFNRVFLMVTDNGHKVVARIPFSIAGPPRLTTSSEVATMEYLRTKTSIPIPKVLTWSDNAANAIGCEFIIMEHVQGVQLHERWETMNSHQRMLCVKGLGMLARDMANLPFPAYGSIYFRDPPIAHNPNLDIGDGFAIGPNCGPTYWNSAPGEVELYGLENSNVGPWSSLSEYCDGLVNAGQFRMPKVEEKLSVPYQGSIDEHKRLLTDGRAIISQLSNFKPIIEAAQPTLFHYDLHKRNIYVSDDDPTVITGIIDWQSTSIEPGFVYASEIPDFTTCGSQDPFSIDKNDAKGDQKDAQICSTTYEVILKGLAKKMGAGRALDETLLRPFRFVATSWRDSAAAVRQELIEVSNQWEELGLPGLCPYQPSASELEEHQKQYEDFETAQKLKVWLMEMINTNSDGWVPNEAWGPAREANKAAFEQWMESAADSGELDEQKARALWPFEEM